MKRSLFVFPLLFSIINSGCFNDGKKYSGTEYLVDNNGRRITRTYDTTGQLVSEITYIDSANGIFLLSKYNKAGIQIDSIPYFNGKIEGLRFQLMSDTLYYSEYKSGIPDGKTFAYNSNKQILYQGEYFNEYQRGEWRFYHSNGKLLTYEYFNSSGNRVFLEKFSPEGNLISVQGNPLIHGKWDDTISIADTFEGIYEVANPPVGKIKFYTGDLDKSNKIINLKECSIVAGDSMNYYDNEARFTYIPKAKGNTAFGIVWKLVDADSVLLSGKMHLNLFVK